MRLPAYEQGGSLNTGGGFRLNAPDTQIADAVTKFGASLQNLGEARGNAEAKTANKLKADAERNENLQLEYDLINQSNVWRDKLEQAEQDAPQSGEGFTEAFDSEMQGDVDSLLKKYESHHDPEYVRVKLAQARNGYQDAASKFEFGKTVEFKKTVLDEKVANLASSFVVDGGPSLEAVEEEYKRFVDTSISGNPNVRKQGYEYGLRTIQKAHLQAVAGRDKKGFVEAYTGTFSAPADSKVLPPHISTSVANAQAQGFDPRLLLGIGWIESKLNPNQRQPTRKDGTVMSSADGMFQVLGGDNPTAAETRAALGISRADVRDVDKVSTALSAHLVRKQEWMRQNRIEPTPGRTYMMWNMGEGAAAAVMRANPNERIENVLSRVWAKKGPEFIQTAIYNNPSMYKPGQTVAQVMANYEAKVQGAMKDADKITSGSGLTSEDRAKAFVKQYGGVNGDQFVTAADVADVAENVMKDYAKEQKDGADISRGQAMLNGQVTIDPYSADDRKQVEKALEAQIPALTEGITKGDGDALSAVRNLAGEVDHVPAPMRNAMRVTMETGEVGAKMNVYGTMLDLKRENLTAFNATQFDADTKQRIEEFEAYTAEMMLTPDKAIELIDRERSEQGKLRKEAVAGDVNKELGKFSDKKVIGHLSVDVVGVPEVNENNLTPIVRSHFDRIYRDAREQGKDKSQAEALAAKSIQGSFGISNLGGEATLMLYPPETQFKAMSNGHEWIEEQARNHVGAYLLTSGRVKTEKHGPTGKMPGHTVPAWKQAEEKSREFDVRLVSTSDTLDDVRRGRPPRYQLWFRNDKGQTEMATEAFTPDEKEAAHVDSARFEAGEIATRRRNKRFDNRGASIIRATRQ